MRGLIKKASFIFGICFLCLLFPIFSAADISDGNVLSVTKIQDSGPDNQRYNIIIMGDGYQTSEIPTFETQAQAFVTAFNNQLIYGPCGSAVNFYRVNIESDDSGVDKPAACYGTAVLRDTYLDCHYCESGTQRCIWSSNIALVQTTATNACTNWHFIVVLVNETENGGCAGGNITFNSTGANFENIVMHELGHAIGDLADEYEEFTNTYTGSEPTRANLTIQTNRANVKWFDLILPTTPVPTWSKPDCTTFSNPPATWAGIIGTYEGGGRHYTCGIYRPATTCLMRSLGSDFCAVCARRIQEVLMDFYAGSNLAITPWGYYQDPKVSPYWQTPDIWCDNNGNGIQEAGEPSIGKSDNHLFARITNNGDAPSGSFQVRFSYVPYTGVIDMNNEIVINTISRPALTNGLTDEVEVLWDLTTIPPAFSGVNHFCVIVQIISDECHTYDNQAQNNFGSVPTVGPSPAPVSLYIKNILDVDATGEIIIEPEPPEWQYTANVPNLKEIPLRPQEEKLITIEFKYQGECGEKEIMREYTEVQKQICAQKQFDISFKLNGQILGGVSTEVIVYPPEYKYSFSLHSGITHPLGNFSNLYKSGVMFGVDVDYHFTKQLSLLGLVAYNGFTSDDPDIDNTHWWNISANLKYAYDSGSGPFAPYINGGGGIYIPKTGSARFGLNVGVGVDYTIKPNLIAEVGANYHNIFTKHKQTKFLVTYVGIVFRF